jgi:large subunit ribosomal protein L30e
MLDELKNAIKDKNVVIGSQQSIKNLKTKSIKMVVLASNCPDSIRKDVEYYSKVAGIKCENFDGTAKQMGVLCGKPFSIAVVAIK